MAIGSRSYARPYLQGAGSPRTQAAVEGHDRDLIDVRCVAIGHLHVPPRGHFFTSSLACSPSGCLAPSLRKPGGTDRFLRYYFTWGSGAGICFVPISWCFCHQLLLGRQRDSPNKETDQLCRFEWHRQGILERHEKQPR